MDRLADQLRHGEVDIGLVMPREAAGDLVQEVVFMEGLVALVRAHHTLAGRSFGVEELLSYPHVSFTITGHGTSAVDRDVEQRGQSRRTILRLPYFLAAPAIVRGGDAIAMVPRSVALALGDSEGVVALPASLGPADYPMALIWSRHVDADPANRWLREQLRSVAHALPPRAKPPTRTRQRP